MTHKQLIRLIGGTFACTALSLLFATSASAQNFNAIANTTITIPDSSINLTLVATSTANSMTVNDANIQFDMSDGQTVTLQSVDGYEISESPSAASVTCVGTGGTSQLVISASTDQVYTITVSTANKACTVSSGTGSSEVDTSGSSGGGGGGGGGGGAAATTTTTPTPTTVTTPTTTASAATKTVEGATGGTAEVTDKSAAISLPAGAVTGSAAVSITPTLSFSAFPRTFGAVAGQAFNIEVKVGGKAITVFAKPVTLTFAYSDAMVKGLKPSTLKVQYYNEATKQWMTVEGTHDIAKKIITVQVSHLTLFAVVGERENIAMAGDLVKLTCAQGAGVNDPCRSVYYLGQNLKRYVFPNEVTYKSWYPDFSGVIEVPKEELQSYPIAANVTMRPGTYLVKITTDPKTYAVEPGGVLRWIPSEEVASTLYGSQWAKRIVDVADPFFINYKFANAVENKVAANAYPNGTVFAYTSAPQTYYYVEAGKKRKVSAGNMAVNMLRTEFVATAPASVTYTEGVEVTAKESAIANIQ